jgi:zinc transport system substrate-binding protein
MHFILGITVMIIALPMQANAVEKVTIFTVNYPLSFFAKQIGGEHVEVVFPVPADEDPAFWNPSTEQIRLFQKADLILMNGAGYAKWTSKVSLPMLRTVDTSKLFKDKLIHIERNVTHSHGPGGDHSHIGTAFTTWLDFSQAAMQAEAIYKALIRKRSAKKKEFANHFAALKKELLEFDERMKELSGTKPDIPFFGSHPIYQYLARRYGLNLQMMMWESDEYPGTVEWMKLQNFKKAHPAEWMIWEGEPMQKSVDKLKESGINSLVFDPCGNRPAKGDFLTVMQDNIENLRRAYK